MINPFKVKSLSLIELINLSIMDVQALKLDLIHWLTELQDHSVLEKLEAFKNQQSNSLTEDQKEWLDKRLASYKENPTNVLSWVEVAKDLEKDL